MNVQLLFMVDYVAMQVIKDMFFFIPQWNMIYKPNVVCCSLTLLLLRCYLSLVLATCSHATNPLSSPIFHGCVNERLADRTPSPTFSTTDSEITELADERQSEMSDLIDDEAFVDDTSSDAGTEEGSDIFSDGQDPFYDRSPWFILVGRLVTCSGAYPCPPHSGRDRKMGQMLA